MNRGTAALRGLLAALMSVGLMMLGESAPVHAGTLGPSLRVIAAQSEVTVTRPRHQPAYLQSGVFFATTGGAFDLRVGRTDYNHPVGVTQVIHSDSGPPIIRPLPSSILDGWNGLAKFLRIKVADDTGKVLSNSVGTFCPASFNEQRVNDQGPQIPSYPAFCFANPFSLGTVWGLDDGWAAGMLDFQPAVIVGPDGHYNVTVSITKRYADLFNVGARNASVTVGVTVLTTRHGGPPPATPRIGPNQAPRQFVRTIKHPSPRLLPDLVALPSWGIGISSRNGHDFLDFGATVWVGGASQLDVEGFRQQGTNVMDAFQYFYRNGKVIGRAPAGTMEFDARNGHDHWHFEQFAGYALLDASKTLSLRSRKTGFCIAPTDPINLELPGATWNPYSVGFFGACGDPSSIWVRESLPLGWGDTYFQSLPGQAFDITNLPNGTYYIQVQANPLHLLYDQNSKNDVRLRRVILRGTPGNRKVRVPPWHGIDTEGAGCGPFCGQG